MTRGRLARGAAALALATGLALGPSAAHAHLAQADTTQPSLTVAPDTTLAPGGDSPDPAPTTTADPVDSAPVLDLVPAQTTDSSSADTGPDVVLLVAAIVLPIIGIAIVVWYWNRARNAAAARARRRTEDTGPPA